MVPHSTDSWSSLWTRFPSSSTSIQSTVLLLILSSALHKWQTASHWISSRRSCFTCFHVFGLLSEEWSLAWSHRCSLQSFGALGFNFSYSLIATFFNQIAWASVQLRGHSTPHCWAFHQIYAGLTFPPHLYCTLLIHRCLRWSANSIFSEKLTSPIASFWHLFSACVIPSTQTLSICSTSAIWASDNDLSIFVYTHWKLR